MTFVVTCKFTFLYIITYGAAAEAWKIRNAFPYGSLTFIASSGLWNATYAQDALKGSFGSQTPTAF